MYNSTIKILQIIFEKSYNKSNPLITLRQYASNSQIVLIEKNDTLISQKETIRYFYFLLSGRLSVLNNITWNNDNVIDTLQPLDILGLVEYLNQHNQYTAYVIAETKCVLFRIPVEEFINIINQNAFLCYQTLCVLGKITESNMNRAEVNSIFHPKDSLGHYLFLQAQHRTPYICPMTRAVLAEKLHINLRTLYRYLDDMAKEEYLALRHGKIVIEDKHFTKLSARYAEIIL